ncbi:hypothetical protein AB6A40_011494 [Gnathostoma spinigerum]|uniref:Uncharacterized protein n=1 Tax=Gnathostoma spinigerum TaxID=75299 RepID=A0ABD6EXV5_9BILA
MESMEEEREIFRNAYIYIAGDVSNTVTRRNFEDVAVAAGKDVERDSRVDDSSEAVFSFDEAYTTFCNLPNIRMEIMEKLVGNGKESNISVDKVINEIDRVITLVFNSI